MKKRTCETIVLCAMLLTAGEFALWQGSLAAGGFLLGIFVILICLLFLLSKETNWAPEAPPSRADDPAQGERR